MKWIRFIRHCFERTVVAPVSEMCEQCDDTGVDHYYSWGDPFYCSRCKKGRDLEAAKRRANRIAHMEREVRR